MASKAGELVLKKSHAACLAALRQHKEAKAQIAIQARLALDKASKGLRELERLGLAKRDEMNRWRHNEAWQKLSLQSHSGSYQAQQRNDWSGR